MFSTRHELSCEAISRAKSIPFFLYYIFFFPGRPFYFSPLHYFLFEKISCHDDVLPIMYTVLCVISFSLTRFLLFFDSFHFFLSFSLQVSGSKLWQTERSCMCCQESGEREATVSLLCPKAAPGEPKLRRVNNNNNPVQFWILFTLSFPHFKKRNLIKNKKKRKFQASQTFAIKMTI